MNAFDYDRQEWVAGQLAISVRQQQLQAELDILKSARGDEWCRFVGITYKQQAIEAIERELASVGREVLA